MNAKDHSDEGERLVFGSLKRCEASSHLTYKVGASSHRAKDPEMS